MDDELTEQQISFRIDHSVYTKLEEEGRKPPEAFRALARQLANSIVNDQAGLVLMAPQAHSNTKMSIEANR